MNSSRIISLFFIGMFVTLSGVFMFTSKIVTQPISGVAMILGLVIEFTAVVFFIKDYLKKGKVIS